MVESLSLAAEPLRFRDDAPVQEPAVTLDSYEGGDANAVRVEAGDDVRALIPHLSRLKLVEIAFPTFRDGRGYSAARILREAGYAGELRAQGDILVDQLPFLRRVGFDSFAPEHPIDPAAAKRALDRYAHVYQRAADGRPAAWAERHG